MNHKICVYSICKNESKFVERWYESIKNADYIVVLDTGSTDDTYDKLSKLENIILGQQIISPWRFDTARNESMKLIPEDTTICVSVDFDDVLPKNWKDIIIEDFNKGYNKIIGKYQYYENDIPTSITNLDRVSKYGEAHWENAIHESLVCKNENIIYDDRFLVEHRQDLTKDRRTIYLETAINGSKDNDYGLLCLGYEYYNIGQYEKSIETFEKLYTKIDKNSDLLTRKWLILLGDEYELLNNTSKKIYWYKKALEINAQNSLYEDYWNYDGRIEKAINKVIVYTICKNEMKNIDNWLKPLLSADKIFILDTGSTDGTYEYLNQLNYNNIYVKQIKYEVFKFNVARNDSLNFAKEYVDNGVALFIDLDEYCSDNIIDEVRKQWNNSYDFIRIYCNNVNMWSFKGHRIDDKIKWYYHIHEKILLDNFKEPKTLDIENAYYNHYQDLTKQRDYYDKLKRANEETPNCIHYLTYLIWEAVLHNDDVKNYAYKTVDLILNNATDEHYKDYEYLIYCLINLPIDYTYMKPILYKIELDILNDKYPNYKFYHRFRAQVYDEIEFYAEEEFELLQTLKANYKYSWIENNFKLSDEDIYLDLVLLAFYKLKDYKKAYYYAKELYNINNSDLNRHNLEICKEYYMKEVEDCAK